MTVETKIPLIDEQGEGERVLSDYQVHTISIVDQGALGVNLSKVKSESSQKDFLKTDKGKELMSKVTKAKALDAESDIGLTEEELKAKLKAEAETEEDVDTETEEDVEEKVEDSEGEIPTVEAEKSDEVESEIVVDETATVESDADVADETPVADVSEDVTGSDEVPVVEAEVEVAVEEEGVAVEKAKSYTSGELIQAQKDALDGVHKLVEKIMASVPDAEVWEVTDLVYSAIWKVEDAVYSAEGSQWDDIYTEVFKEVNSRVDKAKALKIAQDGSLESKLKALELVDPDMALLFKTQAADIATSKAKALEAEEETKRVLRAKALATGAEQYKRIATDDNTTEQIVDAMESISISDPIAHGVVSKALATAATITMGGQLFGDVGSTANAELPVDSATYVEQKAKALTDNDSSMNPATARATVRLTPEYQALYS